MIFVSVTYHYADIVCLVLNLNAPGSICLRYMLIEASIATELVANKIRFVRVGDICSFL